MSERASAPTKKANKTTQPTQQTKQPQTKLKPKYLGDAAGQARHLGLPLLKHRGVADDLGGDARAVRRRVGPDRARDALELAEHARRRLFLLCFFLVLFCV